MYLYMKHRFFSSDHLKLKEGSPRNTEATNWDWRGLWTIQKYNSHNASSSSSTNATEFRFKDHDNNEYAAFAPADLGFVPKGSRDVLQSTLWNMDFRPDPLGSVTTIRNSVPPGHQKYQRYMTALSDDGHNATRAVEMKQDADSNFAKWKIMCGRFQI